MNSNKYSLCLNFNHNSFYTYLLSISYWFFTKSLPNETHFQYLVLIIIAIITDDCVIKKSCLLYTLPMLQYCFHACLIPFHQKLFYFLCIFILNSKWSFSNYLSCYLSLFACCSNFLQYSYFWSFEYFADSD